MENFYYLYNASINKECNPSFEEYVKMQNVIKKDFERLLFLYEDYENNEELIDVFKNVSENILCVFDKKDKKLPAELLTSLSNMYLYFNYIEKKEDDDFDFVTVVASRDFKEFYVTRESFKKFDTTIKKFEINDKIVDYKEYKFDYFPVLFSSDVSIYNSINKLKQLTPVNS